MPDTCPICHGLRVVHHDTCMGTTCEDCGGTGYQPCWQCMVPRSELNDLEEAVIALVGTFALDEPVIVIRDDGDDA